MEKKKNADKKRKITFRLGREERPHYNFLMNICDNIITQHNNKVGTDFGNHNGVFKSLISKGVRTDVSWIPELVSKQ